MHKNVAGNGRHMIIRSAVAAMAAGGVLLLACGCMPRASVDESVLEVDSRELQATQVVATLDAPLREGTNTIWCASFLAAWKTMEDDLAAGPVALEGSPKAAAALNEAADPRPHIPEGSLYVAAGWNQEGITDQIRKDLAQKFPAKAQPTFPGILPDSFVAYAYLEANVKFTLPYFQSREPLVFTDRAGKKTELSSFGIRGEDDYAYFKLRRQPAILFVARAGESGLRECVIDLDRTSQPNQIILALTEPKATLAEMLATVEDRIDTAETEEGRDGLGPNDVLLVPDIVWSITHRFPELEVREFTNPKLEGQRIDVAQQDIQFRLDRSGAELVSEAKSYMFPAPTYYVFDRPFLLYMKKRGAEMPYFVMWVDNAELLKEWQGDPSPVRDIADSDKSGTWNYQGPGIFDEILDEPRMPKDSRAQACYKEAGLVPR